MTSRGGFSNTRTEKLIFVLAFCEGFIFPTPVLRNDHPCVIMLCAGYVVCFYRINWALQIILQQYMPTQSRSTQNNPEVNYQPESTCPLPITVIHRNLCRKSTEIVIKPLSTYKDSLQLAKTWLANTLRIYRRTPNSCVGRDGVSRLNTH